MARKIVDSHLHWRDPVNNRYEALSDGTPEEGEERGGTEASVYMPEDYFADAAPYDIVGLVHIEAEWDKADPVGESKWLERLSSEKAFGEIPFAIVGFADLAWSDIEPILEAHANQPHVRGIRHMLNHIEGRPELCWAPVEHMANPLWQENFGLLAKYDLDFDLMCFGHQIPLMVDLAKKHPDIRIHLEHAALPFDHGEEGRKIWRNGLKALAALERTDVKISGLGNVIEDWTTEKIRRYVLETIEIFGTNRVSFASNFPTDKQFSDMPTIWQAFEAIVSDFSEDEQDALFRSNALEQYRI